MEATPQIRLLAQARWQMFVNALSSKKSKWQDLAGKIIITLLGGSVAFGVAVGLGALVYAGFGAGRRSLLGVAFGVVFWVWQGLPIITAAMSVNFQEIARYPISFRRFCLLEFSVGLIDPVAATCILWLAACWIGVLFGRPSLAPRAALMILLLGSVTLLINRLIFDYLERVLSTRKGRARFFGGLMLLSFGYQILVFTGNRSGENVVRLFQSVSKVAAYFPAGFAAEGVSGSLMRGLAGLAGYAAIAVWPLLRLYRRKYQGEVYSDGRPKVTVKGMSVGWAVPGLSTTGAAMFEKEVRYLFGVPMGFMSFIFGPVAALVTSLGFRSLTSRDLVFPIIAGWVILAVGGRCYSIFSLDSSGFGRYLLSPVTMREVIVSKNLLSASMMVSNFLGAYLVLCFMHPVSGALFLSVLTAYTMAALSSLALGNYFSVHFPFSVDPDRMRAKNTSGAASLGILLVQFAIAGVLAGIFYWKLPALPIFAGLSVIAAWLYWVSLNSAARWAESHSEDIVRMLA